MSDSRKRQILHAPGYDEAWFDVVQQAIDGIVCRDPVFEFFGSQRTSHCGPIRNVRTPRILDQPMTCAEVSAPILRDDILQTNVDRHSEFILEMAKAKMSMMGPQLFQSIAEMTAAADMAIDAAGKPFSADLYLQALEKIDIGFDDDGHPILPSLHVGPALRDVAERAMEEVRENPAFAAILNRKREEFLAKKRTRRLS